MVKAVEELMADVHDDAERLPLPSRQEVFCCIFRKRRGGGMEQPRLNV